RRRLTAGECSSDRCRVPELHISRENAVGSPQSPVHRDKKLSILAEGESRDWPATFGTDEGGSPSRRMAKREVAGRDAEQGVVGTKRVGMDVCAVPLPDGH